MPPRTHEVQGSLVVADDHEGPRQPQPLRAPHPHPDAVEALEGQERRPQEPAEIRDQIRDVITDDIRIEIMDQIRIEIRNEIRGQIRDVIRDDSRIEIRNEIMDEIRNEIRQRDTCGERLWAGWVRLGGAAGPGLRLREFWMDFSHICSL